MPGEIKYRFAKTLDGKIIDINEIVQRDTDYFCLGCGDKLVAKLANGKRQKHFCHYKENHSCSFETYLHKLAKVTLYDYINNRIRMKMPYYLKYERVSRCCKCQAVSKAGCELAIENEKKDILRRYNKVLIEEKVGDYVPDVCLTNGKDDLFLEIVVTHKASMEKINSRYKVIEINIKEENDIDILKNDCIDFSSMFIKTNIDIEPLEKDYSSKYLCIRPLSYFVVYDSGKCIMLNTTQAFYSKIEKRIIYKKALRDSSYTKIDFVSDVIEAYEKGISVKNCHLCRYHAINNSKRKENELVFCKYRKIACNSNIAAECDTYRIDEKSFTRVINGNLTTAST